MTLAAVSDSGPLIHLAEIDSLELLATFDTLIVPETVYKEVDAGGVPDGLADLSYELAEADESRLIRFIVSHYRWIARPSRRSTGEQLQ